MPFNIILSTIIKLEKLSFATFKYNNISKKKKKNDIKSYVFFSVLWACLLLNFRNV